LKIVDTTDSRKTGNPNKNKKKPKSRKKQFLFGLIVDLKLSNLGNPNKKVGNPNKKL
jgi:hypothetical protein